MTGGIGSGKSEASKIFASLNIEVIDLDKISREITKKDHEAIEEIKTLFGQSLFNKENELDRKKLRDIIFSDKNLKIKLENILHPKILAEVKKKLSIFSDEPYVVIDIPLLFETNQYVPLISRTLVIDCELSNQIERARKRDGMEIAMVQSIISQQVDRNKRIQRGDDVILNDSSIESLEDSIKKLHEKYLNLVAVK
jgi:dephospho-CoA kinase